MQFSLRTYSRWGCDAFIQWRRAMAQNLNGFENNLRSMHSCINSVLDAGCQSLEFSCGLLFLMTKKYVSVLGQGGSQRISLPAHIPSWSVHNHTVPDSTHHASDEFLQWALQYFGSAFFIRGKLYETENGQVAMFYFKRDPVDSYTIKYDALTLLDSWLSNLIQQAKSFDSTKNHEALYEKLQNVANIGTWEVDVVNQVLSWSSQTRIIHEVSQDYTPQLNTAIQFYKEGYDRNEINRLVNRAVLTGEPWTATLRLITAKGNEVWVQNHGMVEMVNGECLRIFGTFQNVDKAVRLRLEVEARREEAVTALKERDLLLSRMSHELKTPLNGIMGMLQAIKQEDRKDIREKKTEFALRSADRLGQLINDVLTYTEISSEKFSLAASEFSIEDMIRSLMDEYMPQSKLKGLSLRADLSLDDGRIVVGDAARIRQIISNVIKNAITFTARGEVSVHAVVRQRQSVTHLLISVHDTGEGMSQVTQDSIFKPLLHGDKLSQVQDSKSGLGLSIAKQLIDKMGGEITFRSQPSCGTCFDIIIPLGHSLDNDETLPKHLLDEPLSILVVDDNEINRMVLISMLDAHHIMADEAQNGEIALQKARQKTYDIIFMDCAMPVLDGISATKIIIKENLLSQHGQVVAVTANTDDADRKACKDAGMVVFLSKPIEKSDVFSVVKSTLMKKANACGR